MKSISNAFDIYKGKIRRKIVLSQNLTAFINLLSVYDMLLCERMAKILTIDLINDGFDKIHAQTAAENACLCTLCLSDEFSEPLFTDTQLLMKTLSAEDMLLVVKEYCSLRKDYMGFDKLDNIELESLKKKLNTDFEQVRWSVLKKFNKLPSDLSVKNMSEYDYIYCYIHMLLDNENSYTEGSSNISFDAEEYKRKCGVY